MYDFIIRHVTASHEYHHEDFVENIPREDALVDDIVANANVQVVENDNNSDDDGNIDLDENENVDVNADGNEVLQNFVKTFYKSVEVFIAEIYASNVSRKFVDTVLSGTGELFRCSVEALKLELQRLLEPFQCNDIDFNGALGTINQMLKILEDPFDCMATEYRRLKDFEQQGYFIRPESYVMGDRDTYIKENNVMQLVKQPVYGQIIPMRKVLKCFLETPGTFDSLCSRMTELNNDNSGRITNFIQGDLWKNFISSHDDNKFYIPLNLMFDDYGPDNPLGSRHGKNDLGALYASIPCLPESMVSKSENVFLFCVFKSKDRKEFGNNVAFHQVLDELTYLELEGISITVNGIRRQVYFCCPLIICDNLANNAIHGFVGSFRACHFCRFCKMHRDQIRVHYRSVPANLLRTVANYREDVLADDAYETGIKEASVWNALPSYHCIEAGYCDIAHDVSEGLLNYDLCRILYYCIQTRGYFSLDLLKERIDSFDYGLVEGGNKPQNTATFTLEKLQKCTLNLSASEMLCLSRYLGEIIGDLVPENNPVWRLYLRMREILDIIMCPVVLPRVINYFGTVVQEHHELSIQYFGDVKPKFHNLLHYGQLMKNNGPLVLIDAMPCERQHLIGKRYSKK
ncbi:hypothetical protein FOCC_FOCC016777 [Frankliniella occidentalis]|nr:hypothetical protein FOCC_FOCC016777 [Frankliniella occidentalis]